MSAILVSRAPSPREGSHPARTGAPLALVAFLVSVAFSARTSLWVDEASTLKVLRRSWSEMASMTTEIDLVHAFYYALLHAWVDVVGDSSPAVVRLVSALLVGATTVVIYALGRELSSDRLGVAAALVFAVLPTTTEMGMDARSRALSTLLVASLVLACTRAFRAGQAGAPDRGRAAARWVTVVALGVLAVLANVYDALAVAALGVPALVHARRRRRAAPLVHWGAAAAATAAVTAPFLLATAAQSAQVSWIPPVPLARVPQSFLVSQFFPHAPSLAVVGWGLAGLGVVGLLRDAREGAAPTVLAWLLVPSGTLLLAGTVAPLWTPRYAVLCTPALALLIGAGLLRLHGARRVVVALTLVGLCAVPWAGLRFDSGRTDWVAAGEELRRQRDELTGSAAVIYGTQLWEPSTLGVQDPGAVAGLLDLSDRGGAPHGPGWFYGELRPVEEAAARAPGVSTVWFVGATGKEQDRATRALADRGFRPVLEASFPAQSADRSHRPLSGTITAYRRI